MAGETHNEVSSDNVHTVVQTGMLRGDIHLHTGSARRSSLPRQLPLPPRSCIGREHEVRQISTIVADCAQVLVVEGPGGVGKTTLALHWAYRNLKQYPDGQLYVDLRGFAAAGAPAQAAAVLDGFLAALGVEAGAVPAEPEAAAAMYRSALAGRRVLVVLDNALDTRQVLPLLPGGSSCTVLVTSRSRLSGLATRGARFVRLDVFSEPGARALLADRLTTEAVNADPDAVNTLVAGCAGLPLALAIVAARAAAHPDFPLSALAVELREESVGLDAFDAGDEPANLRAVLSWSSASLDHDQSRAFRLLGIAPTSDIDVTAAASLLGVAPGEVTRLLRVLETKNLLRQHEPRRFRMHDLVRRHAAELAAATDPMAVRTQALRRLVSFYLRTARAADRLLYPHRKAPDPPAPPEGSGTVPLSDVRAALAWFSQEHQALLTVVQAAVREGWHEEVWHLAHDLDTYQYRLGLLHDSIATARLGLAAAEKIGGVGARASSLRQLGRALTRAGQLPDALSHLEEALRLVNEAGDPTGKGHTHHDLQRVHGLLGDYADALHHAASAAAAYRVAGNPVGEAHALNARGFQHAQLRQYDLAERYCTSALALHIAHGNLSGQLATLGALGLIARQTGRLDEAVRHFSEVTDLAQRLGNRFAEAEITEQLADVLILQGKNNLAAQTLWTAHDLFTRQHRTHDAERVHDRLKETRG